MVRYPLADDCGCCLEWCGVRTKELDGLSLLVQGAVREAHGPVSVGDLDVCL